MMFGKNHFVNSENAIDRESKVSDNNFISINGGDTLINTKSISQIVRIKYWKEFIELAEGQRIKPSDFEHLRNPTPPALEENTFTSLPREDERQDNSND